jgi:RNA polymerase sigma factor (sigma-70 family)
MRSRSTLLDAFSTFIQFQGDQFGGWVVDAKLRRNMQRHLQQASEVANQSEQFWALYWYKQWQEERPDAPPDRAPHSAGSHFSTSLPINHLTAYLQEVCFWVARKIRTNLGNTQPLADLFQTAIARIPPVLQRFNPQLSANLRSYAEFAFSNVIKDSLRQQQQADICTDWSLLQKTSQKRLIEALETAGYDPATVQAYRLAWCCFKELYAPSDRGPSRKLTRPEAATWQAIAHLYNRQRLSQLGQASPECRPAQLETWIQACAKAIRAFLFPKFVSPDLPTDEGHSMEVFDLVVGSDPARLEHSPMGELIAQEEQAARYTQHDQLSQHLHHAIAQLDGQTQQIVAAYYSHTMTQQQIADSVGMKQYTVSRRLNSAKQTLLKALAQWSQAQLHKSIDASVLESMSAVLEEWLSAHYQPPNPLPQAIATEEYL